MLGQLGIAISSYGRALELLFKKGIRHYLVFPVLINVGLLILVIWGGIKFGPLAPEWLFSIIPGWQTQEWQITLTTWIVNILLIGLYIITYKYLVLIVISPVLAFLSERVERELNGREFPFSWGQLAREGRRAVIINVRNFVFEVGSTLVLAIVAFIPVIGLISPIAILIIQSYFFGFAMMDFNAERYRMTRKQTERWMRSHFWGVVGIGLLFHLTFLIPILGWIIAPILGTIAGTVSFIKLESPVQPDFISSGNHR